MKAIENTAEKIVAGASGNESLIETNSEKDRVSSPVAILPTPGAPESDIKEAQQLKPEALSVRQQMDQLIEQQDFESASLLIDANSNADQQILQELKTKLADAYHFRAALAYRGQELDKSIALWDKALAIDPNHTNANIFRAQAIDLRDKLSTLK